MRAARENCELPAGRRAIRLGRRLVGMTSIAAHARGSSRGAEQNDEQFLDGLRRSWHSQLEWENGAGGDEAAASRSGFPNISCLPPRSRRTGACACVLPEPACPLSTPRPPAPSSTTGACRRRRSIAESADDARRLVRWHRDPDRRRLCLVRVRQGARAAAQGAA